MKSSVAFSVNIAIISNGFSVRVDAVHGDVDIRDNWRGNIDFCEGEV
jgi:hypothetical protein